jgi:hypothetical protein
MSSNYTEKIFDKQRPVFFSGADADAPWTDTDAATRFYLNFPFYPFRTLNPRDTVILRPSKSSSPSSLSFNSGMDFDYASCLLPAHTQLSITMKRRRELLNYMVPMQLVPTLGDHSNSMTQDQRQAALTFTVTQPPADGAAAGAPAVRITYRITSVQVTLDDMVLLVSRKKKNLNFFFFSFGMSFLQVCRIKYKSISPERPLSNVYNAYRSVFTPVQNVSLHHYDLSWESRVRPTAVFIGFVK